MARRAKRTAPSEPGLFDPPRAEPAEGAADVLRERDRRRASRRPPGTPEAGAEAGPTAPPQPSAEPRPFTVGELTRAIQGSLQELGRIRVEGEVSSLRRHTSGHVYFDLKDDGARLGCVIWRSRVSQGLAVKPEDGMAIVAHGRLDVYAPRGSYSLIVDRLELRGVGELLARLEELKAELRAKGWFERSRPLPDMPRRVGLVTSRDGAALRDFLRTRSLRFAGYPVRLRHTPVQGPEAAPAIAEAIRDLDASRVDVICVCRGGGSLEDLWAFNERVVAEAIRAASVPVVTGIGHESDTTLADLVADHRAHTPTDAAQTAIPDRATLEDRLVRAGNYLVGALDSALLQRTERLAALARRACLRRPEWILGQRRAALEAARARLGRAAASLHERRAAPLQSVALRLEQRSPRLFLERTSARIGLLGARLRESGDRALDRGGNRLAVAARALEGISPLAVLGRGYSLTRRAGDSAPLEDVGRVSVDEEVETQLARGSLVARVVETRPPDGEGP